MIDQRIADHAAGTRHDVEHAGRQARFQRQLTDAQCGERGQFSRLHHDGAAAGQRRRKLPHADHQREIPGHDHGDNADRLAHRVGERIRTRRDHVAADLVGPAGIICEGIDRRGQVLAQHSRNRLAGIAAFQLGQFVRMPLHQFGELEQDVATLGGAHGAPDAFEGAAGGDYGALDIGLVAFRNRRDHLFGGGIERFERAAGHRLHMLPVDQQLLVRNRRCGGRVMIVICNRHHISSGCFLILCIKYTSVNMI